MLRRLSFGFFMLACIAVVAACSSNTTTPSSGGIPGIGPNFPQNTVYVTNTTQQTIEIFTPSPGPSSTPQFTIGGSNTTMSGPQYLAFNSSKQLVCHQLQSGHASCVDPDVSDLCDRRRPAVRQ